MDGQGADRLGRAGLAGQGRARSGRERIGRQVARLGKERIGTDWIGRKGRAWAARNGLAGNVDPQEAVIHFPFNSLI
jgi:hypothetical protein